MSAITIDNVYKVLLNFDKVYDRLNDEEKRTMIQGFIKEIQIYPKEEQEKYEHPIKNITFNFPVTINGEEVDKISWEKGNTVETCVLLSKLKSTQHIDVKIDLDEMDLTKAESKATYAEIKEYVLEKHGLKVSQVPLEKEKAIEDALRHFQMI